VGETRHSRCARQYGVADERRHVAPKAAKNRGIPHPSIDTEAGWSKSGWHAWWYGWKLHLAVSVGSIWIPLAAELTVANIGDNRVAPKLIEQLPSEVRYALGDTHYNDPDLRLCGEAGGSALVATWRGPHPHTDGGVAVRRIFHQLR